MNVTIKLHDRNGKEIECLLPGKYEVCWRCEGEGKHTKPSIDGNGLTAEDFYEDPDFSEAYFSGRYDVICSECQGNRVIPVADPSRCTYAEKRLLVSERIWQREEAEYRALVRAEMRMGA